MADHHGQDVVQHGISWALVVSQRNVVTRARIHRPLTNKSLTQEPALKPFHTCIVRYWGQPYPTRPGNWACQEAARRCWPWASSLQPGREINYGILQTYAPRFILPDRLFAATRSRWESALPLGCALRLGRKWVPWALRSIERVSTCVLSVVSRNRPNTRSPEPTPWIDVSGHYCRSNLARGYCEASCEEDHRRGRGRVVSLASCGLNLLRLRPIRNPRSCGISSLVMPHHKPGYSVCLLFVYHGLAGSWVNEAAVMRTPSAFPMLESATSPRNRQPWQPCVPFCHRRPCAVALRGLTLTGNT